MENMDTHSRDQKEALQNDFKVKVKVIEMSMSAKVYRHALFECHSLNIVFLW